MSKRIFNCPESLLTQPITVTLVGVGGTGSNIFDGLVQLHHALLAVGHPHGLDVTVYDPDIVSGSNIGRQRFTHSDINQPKARILVNRYNFAFGLDWKAVPHAFDIVEDYNHEAILITCVDTVHTRKAIGEYFKQNRESGYYDDDDSLWLDHGNGSTQGQAILGHCYGNKGRLPNVYDLYPELSTMKEDNKPSCSLAEALLEQDLFINRLIADQGLNLLWQLLRKGRLENHGVIIDIDKASTHPIPINNDVWSFMGYAA